MNRNPKEKTSLVYIRCTPDFKEALYKQAEKERRTLTEVLTQAVKEYIERHKKDEE